MIEAAQNPAQSEDGSRDLPADLVEVIEAWPALDLDARSRVLEIVRGDCG